MISAGDPLHGLPRTIVYICDKECTTGRHVVTIDKAGMHIECSTGTLEHVDEGAEACDGAMWYTNARATEHAVAWKSPTCCDFNGTEAQIFVTASKFEHDFLRQQQLFVEASESECADPALYCSGAAFSPACLNRSDRHATTRRALVKMMYRPRVKLNNHTSSSCHTESCPYPVGFLFCSSGTLIDGY